MEGAVDKRWRASTLRNGMVRWLPLAGVLIIALLVRVGSMTQAAHLGDLEHFAHWMRVIDQEGLLRFYEPEFRFSRIDRTYPALTTLTFGVLVQLSGIPPDPQFVAQRSDYISLMKLFPVAFELALIVVVYAWLTSRPVWRWLIPLLLALAPGLAATSAWWGQLEALPMLFLVLSLIALNRDRPLWAWIMFALALLTKQQAAALTPLLVLVTLRRYGFRTLLLDGGAAVLIFSLVTLPFVFGSGLDNALYPYLSATTDAFPSMTNNAFNLWFALASINKGSTVFFGDPTLYDGVAAIGGLTFKGVGYVLYGGYVLLISAFIWRQGRQRREFLWAAALFLGFFMLPTQAHERYLYPGVVLTLIAIAQDRRVWWAALCLINTYTYNVYAAVLHPLLDNPLFAVNSFAVPVALVNTLLFLYVTYTVIVPPRGDQTSVSPAAAVAQ